MGKLKYFLGDTYEDKINGYIMECVRGHQINFGRIWVAQHIVRMCEKIGRPLKKGEVVHHKNHKKHDNRLRNLQLMSRAEHAKLHHTGVPMSEEVKTKLAAAAKARITPEWRAMVSARAKKQHAEGKFGYAPATAKKRKAWDRTQPHGLVGRKQTPEHKAAVQKARFEAARKRYEEK
jgi:hypothetical protein